tara:strand:+ start:56 stop:424 length:369 start_codon:yes stop_codon:yes gene_type:complete
MAFKMNGWSAFTKATDARKFSKDNPPAVRREETNDGTPFAKETDKKPKVGQTYRSWLSSQFPLSKGEHLGPVKYWNGSEWTTEKPGEVDPDIKKQETKRKIFKKGVEIGGKILSTIKENKPK